MMNKRSVMIYRLCNNARLCCEKIYLFDTYTEHLAAKPSCRPPIVLPVHDVGRQLESIHSAAS